jgi:hypothetical protein
MESANIIVAVSNPIAQIVSFSKISLVEWTFLVWGYFWNIS